VRHKFIFFLHDWPLQSEAIRGKLFAAHFAAFQPRTSSINAR
jgi:hypothetical protein